MPISSEQLMDDETLTELRHWPQSYAMGIPRSAALGVVAYLRPGCNVSPLVGIRTLIICS